MIPSADPELRRPKSGTPKRAAPASSRHDPTDTALLSEIRLLKKKLSFLQQLDLKVLNDETSQGDVTFILKDKTVVKAHRFVLASKSSIFKTMFDTNMKEKRSGQIYINDDVKGPILRSVINYLYMAEIAFTDEATASEVLKVAHKYDIPELQEVCEAHLINTVEKGNLSEMLRIAHVYGLAQLMEEAVDVLKENFDDVCVKVLSDLLS